MTFYQNEINRIRNICYSNEKQIPRVIETRNFINCNYSDPLNLEILSHNQFTSKFHLLRLFKRYYGQTPKQYLTQKRMEKSREFLAEGFRVSEVCYLVGFESPSSFSTLFKRINGQIPIEYQKEQLSQRRFYLDFENL